MQKLAVMAHNLALLSATEERSRGSLNNTPPVLLSSWLLKRTSRAGEVGIFLTSVKKSLKVKYVIFGDFFLIRNSNIKWLNFKWQRSFTEVP